MISQYVKQLGVRYKNVLLLPTNVCRHCGDSESPESTYYWPDDEDGDRICARCASGEPKALVKFNKCVDCGTGTGFAQKVPISTGYLCRIYFLKRFLCRG